MRQVIWLDFGIILGIGRPQADFSTRFGPQQYWVQGIAFTECISHKVFIKDLQQGVVCFFLHRDDIFRFKVFIEMINV